MPVGVATAPGVECYVAVADGTPVAPLQPLPIAGHGWEVGHAWHGWHGWHARNVGHHVGRRVWFGHGGSALDGLRGWAVVLD